MINAYGYGFTGLKGFISFLKVTMFKMRCNHKRAKFHAATSAKVNVKNNIDVGVAFVCPGCKRSWAGDIRAGYWGAKQGIAEKINLLKAKDIIEKKKTSLALAKIFNSEKEMQKFKALVAGMLEF